MMILFLHVVLLFFCEKLFSDGHGVQPGTQLLRHELSPRIVTTLIYFTLRDRLHVQVDVFVRVSLVVRERIWRLTLAHHSPFRWQWFPIVASCKKLKKRRRRFPLLQTFYLFAFELLLLESGRSVCSCRIGGTTHLVYVICSCHICVGEWGGELGFFFVGVEIVWMEGEITNYKMSRYKF